MHLVVLGLLRASQAPKPSKQRQTQDTREKWIPRFLPNGRRGAAAAICRRKQGEHVGASAIAVENIDDPSCLEALAGREGLALAEDLSL